MEIGFGDGRFLSILSAQHPEWNLLGAERSSGSVVRARARVLREGRRRVRLYHGHAVFLLRNLVPTGGLHRIYVNFPDPWPKKRHVYKRLLRAPFFRLLSTRLEDDAALMLTTDHWAYFEYALSEARSTGLFEVLPGPPPGEVLHTKYALKWRALGKPIFHATLRKHTADSAPHPVIERYPMPHAVLNGAIPSVQRFDKQVRRFAFGTVVLLDAYAKDNGELLVRVQVTEQDLEQQVLLRVRLSRRGIVVEVDGFGRPLITPGVHQAVRSMAMWLERQGAVMVESAFRMWEDD